MALVGAIAMAAGLALLGRWPVIEVGLLLPAFGLAALGLGSLALLYRGLVLGPIAVVSPIAGAYLAITVLLVVAFLGERLTTPQVIAICVTFTGVVLASTDARELARTLGRPTHGVVLAVGAMLGFGLWGFGMAAVTRTYDPLALTLLIRAFGLPLLLVLLAVRRFARPARVSARMLAVIVGVGLLDTTANVAYALGTATGHASIVATASGAYAVIPAVLAFFLLRERLAPNQYIGIAIVIAGLVMLGAYS